MTAERHTYEWDEAAWRADTELLTPEMRGIYRDILGHLYLQDRSGVITGTREELAGAGRCSAVQLDVTIQALARHRVANISERNGLVTIVNRRMKRAAQQLGKSLHPKLEDTLKLKGLSLSLGKGGLSRGKPAPARPATACRSMTAPELAIAALAESTMNGEWANDSRKWLNRITGNAEKKVVAEPGKVRRVFEEVVQAARENRIKTTPARYAEQLWKEFK